MNALFICLLVALVTVANAANLLSRDVYEKMFFDHLTTYGIHFTEGNEFVQRLQIFADNVDAINTHNAQNLSWKQGKEPCFFSHSNSIIL